MAALTLFRACIVFIEPFLGRALFYVDRSIDRKGGELTIA